MRSDPGSEYVNVAQPGVARKPATAGRAARGSRRQVALAVS
jgi:hypothetical protein